MHYLVANMAISDLVIPVIFLPQQIAEAYNDSVWLVHGVLGNFLCKLVRVSLEVSFAVSVLTMATIAVDRFHGILFTFKPPLITRKTCLRIIAVIWVAAAAFRAPSWYGYRLVREDTGTHCVFRWGSAWESIAVQGIMDLIWMIFTFISAIVITVLYSSISVYLYRQKNNVRLASEIIQQRAKENRKITFMLVAIVFVFYIVWFPFNVMFIIFQVPGDLDLRYLRVSCFTFWMVLYAIPVLYPVLNPIIHYVFNEKYRRGMQELLCCPGPCSITRMRTHASVSPQAPVVIANARNAVQPNLVGAENIEIHQQ